jgi:hypothetical protein
MRYRLIPRLREHPLFQRLNLGANLNGMSTRARDVLIRTRKAEKDWRKISCDDISNVPANPAQEIRFASPADVYRLAVAMSSRNLKDVEDRLQNGERCILILEDGRIRAHFWLSYSNSAADENARNNVDVVVRQWGINRTSTVEGAEDEYIDSLFLYLRERGLCDNGLVIAPDSHNGCRKIQEKQSGRKPE